MQDEKLREDRERYGKMSRESEDRDWSLKFTAEGLLSLDADQDVTKDKVKDGSSEKFKAGGESGNA